MLLEDVDQLEVERKGPGRGDGLSQIHAHDQFDDLVRGVLLLAKALVLQQPFRLIGGAFAAQHRAPEVLHQLEAFIQLTQRAAADRGSYVGQRNLHAG